MHIFNVVEMIPHGSGKRRKRRRPNSAGGQKNVGRKWPRGESVAWLLFLLLRVFLLVSSWKGHAVCLRVRSAGGNKKWRQEILKRSPHLLCLPHFLHRGDQDTESEYKMQTCPFSRTGVLGQGHSW